MPVCPNPIHMSPNVIRIWTVRRPWTTFAYASYRMFTHNPNPNPLSTFHFYVSLSNCFHSSFILVGPCFPFSPSLLSLFLTLYTSLPDVPPPPIPFLVPSHSHSRRRIHPPPHHLVDPPSTPRHPHFTSTNATATSTIPSIPSDSLQCLTLPLSLYLHRFVLLPSPPNHTTYIHPHTLIIRRRQRIIEYGSLALYKSN